MRRRAFVSAAGCAAGSVVVPPFACCRHYGFYDRTRQQAAGSVRVEQPYASVPPPPPPPADDPSARFFEAEERQAPSGGNDMFYAPPRQLAEWQYSLPAAVIAFGGGLTLFHVAPAGPIAASAVLATGVSLVYRRDDPRMLARYVADAPGLLVRDALVFAIGPAAGVLCIAAYAVEPAIVAMLAAARMCAVPLSVSAADPLSPKLAAAAWALLLGVTALKYTLFEPVGDDDEARAAGRLDAADRRGDIDPKLVHRYNADGADAREPPQPAGGAAAVEEDVSTPSSLQPPPAASGERSIPSRGRLVPAEVPPHLKDMFRSDGGSSGSERR